MAIVQISKIQHRSGNLVDLPQLDEAELGFASDAKRVFIGKTQSGLENIEVLTSYSEISFSQIDGAIGNLVITAPVGNGEVLAFDGSDWVNKGGNTGGYINLGDVSNLSIGGGSIGYVLETDGLGNLSWTTKGTTVAYIENITQDNPGVVTTTQDNFLTNGSAVTITDCPGMSDINGGTYYANVLTANTFSLYTDQILVTPLDTTSFNAFSYTSVTDTTAATNTITVGDSSLFALNIPVKFVGDVSGTELDNDTTYYIKTKPSGTTITVSKEIYANGTAGNVWPVNNVTGLSANVYGSSGRLVSPLGGAAGGLAAAGANTSIQYNYNNILTGDADFTWEFGTTPKVLGVTGNANITGNINTSEVVTASRIISNVATGTTPLVVSSTTRVANLNVSYSNVTDYSVVGNLTTGNYFPALVSGSATGNKALNVSGSYTFDTANARFVAGNIVANYDVQGSTLTGSLTTNAQPNITSVGTLAGLEVSGNITPDANITYDLGNNTNRFNDLYLSGSTIYLGAQQLTSNLTTSEFSGNLVVNGNVDANVMTGNILSVNQANINAASVTGNVSAGNISTGGALSVTGNATAGNVYANSGTVGAAAGTFTTVTGSLTTAAQPNITSVGTLTSLAVTGNLSAGNISTGGELGVTGDISANNVSATNDITATTLGGTLTTSAQPNITSVGTLTSLDVSGQIDLGDVSNVIITGGNANQILQTNGTGNLTWADPTGGYFLHEQTSANLVWVVEHNLNRQYVTVEVVDGNGNSYTGRYDYPLINYTNANALTMTFTSAVAGFAAITGGGTNINSVTVGNSTPGGVNTQVQFNDSGTLNGSLGLVFDKTTGTLTSNNIVITNDTNLGSVNNIAITGGNANQILATDGSGNLSWVDPTGGYYLHTQSSVSNVWLVTHNLNRRYVNVEAIDGTGESYAGRYDFPAINYVNANALTMTFNSAVSGYAAVTGGGTNINSVLVGNSTPAGVDTSVQYNNAGNLEGASNFTYDRTTGTLSVNLVESTLTTAAQPNITSVGVLNGLVVDGNITPADNVVYDLGNSTNRFNDLYLSGNTIFLGDQQIRANSTSVTLTGEVLVDQMSVTSFVTTDDMSIDANIELSGNILSTNDSILKIANQNEPNATFILDFSNAKATFNGGQTGLGTLAIDVEATGEFIALRPGDIAVPGQPSQMNYTHIGMYPNSDGTKALEYDTTVNKWYTEDFTTDRLVVDDIRDDNQIYLWTGNNARPEVVIDFSNNFTQFDGGWNGLTYNDTEVKVLGALTVQRTSDTPIPGEPTDLEHRYNGIVPGGAVDKIFEFYDGNWQTDTLKTNAVYSSELKAGADPNTIGYLSGNWLLTNYSKLQATYADLAEYYEGDQVYEAGTVLMFGGEKEVTLAENETFRVAGVVSTNPAYLMNAECPGNKVAVALQGRCPVKVKGPVSKGDMMVSAGNGFAKATITAPQMGTVLGKSLENFDGEEGVIEIAIGRL